MPAPKRKKATPVVRAKAVVPPEKVPEFEERCRYVEDGERCPLKATARSEYCVQHVQQAEWDAAKARENKIVGDITEADLMRAELAQLRADKAALLAENVRLQSESPPAQAFIAADPAAELDAAAEAAQVAAQMQGEVDWRAAFTTGSREARAERLPSEEEQTQDHLMALLREAQEKAYAERDAKRRLRRGRGQPVDEGRPPIEMRVEIPAQLDPAQMVDEAGNNLVPPGWVGRWLRDYELDPAGTRHPSDYRIRFHRQVWGAKPVMEPVYDESGKPTGEKRHKKGLCGHAYMMPIDSVARKIIHHSQHGAFDSELDKEAGALDNFAEQENRRAGKRGGVTAFVQEPDHGQRTSYDVLSPLPTGT